MSKQQTAPTLETMLEINDLADLLNVSRRTVERLRTAGKVPKPDMHVGKMPRWNRETIRRWVAEQGERN